MRLNWTEAVLDKEQSAQEGVVLDIDVVVDTELDPE